MPLQLPELDNRNFEQLLQEAKRRIPIHTPEWTNFDVESDPGITLVQVFSFLTESLLYRANRIPERNRIKFLQLLEIPLKPPAPADGIIAIHNERGPVEARPLNRGIVVSAGNVDFLTRDPVNVLPVEAHVYYKRRIPETDPRFAEFKAKYEAVEVAALASEADTTMASDGTQPISSIQLEFYETTRLLAPTPGDPNPEVDLTNTSDRAVYMALLAPKNVSVENARSAIADQTLSIGIVPALAGDIPPLRPHRPVAGRAPLPNLIYGIVNVQQERQVASYSRLPLLQDPNVLTEIGIVQVQLPSVDQLQTWSFPEPLDEGTGEFPPRLEDEEVSKRLITWIRISLPTADDAVPLSVSNQELSGQAGRLTWVGINATRVTQAVPIFNELLGQGTGEPDQVVTLANKPVIKNSVSLVIESADGIGQPWRLTDDLLAASPERGESRSQLESHSPPLQTSEGTGSEDKVFTLDSESGKIRFGDGLRGARPPAGRRILASYEYGGGPLGNVGIGAIKTSRDLPGGYLIENPIPTSGGSLGESVADGERNIPLVVRHRDRLVTEQDFKDVVGRAPGVDVGRVEVLPLFIPKNSQEAAPGVVTVMVIPKFDSRRPLWPTPDRLFLRRVCDHLDSRRLITTEVYVRGPEYKPVYVSTGIQVRGGFFPDLVRAEVDKRLKEYLSALPPGGPESKGWPLNKRLVRKDLEAVITRIPGVEFVNSLEMGVESPVDIPDYDFSGLKLPLLAGLSVREGTAEPIASIVATTPSPEPANIKVVHVPVTKAKC